MSWSSTVSMFLMLLAADAKDVRDVATAWVEHHNEAVDLLAQGDSEQALKHAKIAADLAPNTRKRPALEVLAMAAAAEHEVITECDALDELLTYDTKKWQLYWNGALDAQSEQMWASAYRYAWAAMEISADKPAVAPLAFSTALRVEQLDHAQEALGYFENPLASQDLAAALAQAGRCEDAKVWDPEAC